MDSQINEKQDRESKPKKIEPAKRQATVKKVDLETSRLIQQMKDKANRKPYGRKVKDSEILALAVRLLTPEHIKELQEATLSERDRLQMVHEDYQKAHGKISMDQFLGKLLRGEIKTH